MKYELGNFSDAMDLKVLKFAFKTATGQYKLMVKFMLII